MRLTGFQTIFASNAKQDHRGEHRPILSNSWQNNYVKHNRQSNKERKHKEHRRPQASYGKRTLPTVQYVAENRSAYKGEAHPTLLMMPR